MDHAFRTFQADDQHVFGEPAFRAGLVARDAQRMALLAEQGVAAVARADALDREFVREVHDEPTFRIKIASGVKAFDKSPFSFNAL